MTKKYLVIKEIVVEAGSEIEAAKNAKKILDHYKEEETVLLIYELDQIKNSDTDNDYLEGVEISIKSEIPTKKGYKH